MMRPKLEENHPFTEEMIFIECKYLIVNFATLRFGGGCAIAFPTELEAEKINFVTFKLPSLYTVALLVLTLLRWLSQ